MEIRGNRIATTSQSGPCAGQRCGILAVHRPNQFSTNSPVTSHPIPSQTPPHGRAQKIVMAAFLPGKRRRHDITVLDLKLVTSQSNYLQWSSTSTLSWRNEYDILPFELDEHKAQMPNTHQLMYFYGPLLTHDYILKEICKRVGL